MSGHAMPVVAVVMGSDSDWPTLKLAVEACQEFGLSCHAQVLSAHRTPEDMIEFGKTAHARGFKVIIARDQLSAFHIRQLNQLNNPEVEKRAAAVWGRFGKTSDEKKSQIAALEKTFNEAPLWAYSAAAGRGHFQKLCAQCHKLNDDGVQFGPDLTGSARHGISYFLENTIDPNAVVGADFQMTTLETTDGEHLTGLQTAETETTVTIRNQTQTLTIPKTKIKTRALSEKSIMPEGLLDALPPREQLELLKYLTGK